MATVTCLEPLDSAASDSGVQYELKMAALVALRVQQTQSDFQLFRNVAIALPFDDVVLRLSSGSDSVLVLTQLKHSEGKGKPLDLQAFAPKKSIGVTRKGDSNLREYFDFFGRLHRMVEDEEQENQSEDEKLLPESPIDKNSFISYNKKVLKVMEKEMMKIENRRKQMSCTSAQYQVSSRREGKTKEKGDFNLRKYFEFYERLHQIHEKEEEGLTNDEKFLRETSLNRVSFVIYTNKVMREIKTVDENDYMYEKLLSTNTVRRSFHFDESCQMVWDLFGDGDRGQLFRHHFLPRLRVFHQQAHVSELDNLILLEIQKIMEKPLPRHAAKQIVRNVLKEVQVWARSNSGECLHRGSCLLERGVATELRREAWGVAGRLHFSHEHCRPLQEALQGSRSRRLQLCVEGTPAGVRATKLLQVLDASKEFQSKWLYLNDSMLEIFSLQFLKAVCNICDVIALDTDLSSYQHSFQELLAYLRDEQIVVHIVNSDSTNHKYEQIKEHWTLNQLTKECQERYLNRFINFQGKLITLKNLGTHWKEMQNEVDTKLLAALGRKIPKFGKDIFVSQDKILPRRLSHHHVVSSRALTDNWVLRGERLALQGFPKELLEDVALRLGFLHTQLDEDFIKENPRWTVLNYKDEPAPKVSKEFLQSLAKENATPTIHCVEYISGRTASDVRMMWKDSFGDTEAMQSLIEPITEECSTDKPLCIHQSEMSLKQLKRVLLVGEAGLGKSTSLSKMASHLKHEDPTQWIVEIHILQHRDLLRKWSKGKEVTMDHVMELVTSAAGVETGSVGRCLETALKQSGSISVLVDGVDEVASAFKELVLRLLELLVDHAPVARVWVSSRPEVDVSLRAVLRSPPIALLPLTQDEQRQFVCERIASDSQDVVRRAQELVQLMAHNTDESLLGIPLHLHMAAEVFHLTLKQDLHFRIDFSLFNLYEEFVEQKRHLYESKYSLLPDEPLDFDEKHQKCAILFLFADDPLANELLPLEEIKEYVLNNDSLLKAKEKSGIVWMDESKRISFVHQTFAEFFAAKWLFRSASSSEVARSFVLRTMRREELMKTRVQVFLEDLLEEEAEGEWAMHVAAWRRDMKRVQRLVEEGGGWGEERWDRRDPLLKWTFGEYVAWAYEGYIQLFPEERDYRHPWMVIAFKAAAESGCPAVVSEILHRDSLPLSTSRSALRSAVEREDGGHLEVARLLLEHGVDEDTRKHDTLLHLAVHRGSEAMVDLLLRHSRDLNAKDFDDRTPLHLALELNSSYHRHEIAQRFLQEETVDVHAEDNVGQSPLSCAASAECASCVETLLERGAKPNCGGIPPIVSAACSNSINIIRILLKYGSEVNITNKYRNSALHVAVFNGNKEAVQLLLLEGADVNLSDDGGDTPLELAQREGREEIANILKGHLRSRKALRKESIEDLDAIFTLTTSAQRGCVEEVTEILKNSSLSSTDLSGALWSAAPGESSRHTEVVRVLLEHGAQDSQESKVMSALHRAAMGGNVATLELLLNVSFDFNAQDRYGRSPLHWAVGLDARSHRHEAAQRLLKEQSVDVSAETYDGATPLVYLFNCLSCAETLLRRGAKVDGGAVSPLLNGVTEYNMQLLRFLVQNGVRLNVRNTKVGWTALHNAAFRGQNEAVHLLLCEGADINLRSCRGETALDIALRQRKNEVVNLLQMEMLKNDINRFLIKAAKNNNAERITSLLDEGANPNARDEKGNSALHWSARKGHQNALVSLLSRGASVYSVNSKGTSPLHYASWQGHARASEQLLQRGAKINAKDCNGATAMHHGARQGHLEVLEVLLKHGADVNSVNDEGDTPMHLACKLRLLQVLKLLLRHGANVSATNSEGDSPFRIAVKQGFKDAVELLQRE